LSSCGRIVKIPTGFWKNAFLSGRRVLLSLLVEVVVFLASQCNKLFDQFSKVVPKFCVWQTGVLYSGIFAARIIAFQGVTFRHRAPTLCIGATAPSARMRNHVRTAGATVRDWTTGHDGARQPSTSLKTDTMVEVLGQDDLVSVCHVHC
jgi:hypothetical protein